MKVYELHLPVFKQGDDLAHQIESLGDDLRAAFEAQATNYDEAARLCRRMAGVAAEVPELEIEASTHMIEVGGPEGQLQKLVDEGVLVVNDYEDADGDGLDHAEIGQGHRE